jgi:anaerobic dimethyl sulfoxide reductase subunit A
MHRAWISVADANARGINDNDLVRVFSDVGEMYIPAYVTARITPGVVAIYHGGYYQPGGVASTLMPDGIDTGGNMNLLTKDDQPGNMFVSPIVGSGPVQVEKVVSSFPTTATTTS